MPDEKKTFYRPPTLRDLAPYASDCANQLEDLMTQGSFYLLSLEARVSVAQAFGHLRQIQLEYENWGKMVEVEQ